MEEEFDVGLFYQDGSYQLTTLVVTDGQWPKYIVYKNQRFIVHNKLPNGIYQYKETDDFILADSSPVEVDKMESEEVSFENLCNIVEEQQGRIDAMGKEILAQEETIVALRKLIKSLQEK